MQWFTSVNIDTSLIYKPASIYIENAFCHASFILMCCFVTLGNQFEIKKNLIHLLWRWYWCASEGLQLQMYIQWCTNHLLVKKFQKILCKFLSMHKCSNLHTRDGLHKDLFPGAAELIGTSKSLHVSPKVHVTP